MIKKIIGYLLVFSFFGVLVFGMSYKMLPNKGGVFYNDGAYFWNIRDNIISVATTFSEDYLGQDQSNILFLYTTKPILALLGEISGLSDYTVTYLLSFGIIYFCALVYYFVFRIISGNSMYGILSGTIIILNNLALEHIGFGGMYYYYLGLIAFALVFFIFCKIHRAQQIKPWHVCILLLTSIFCVLPFYLVIYGVLVLLIFIYSGYALGWRKSILNFVWFSLPLILLHAYWISPFVYGTLNRPPIDTYGGNLDAVFSGFKKIATLTNQIQFRQYFGLFSEKFDTSPLHILLYFLPLFGIILTLIFQRKNKPFLWFIILVYLVFFSLALGPNSPLTGELWMWCWEHISVFSFFRSFSRFLIIIIPIYLFFFAIYFKDGKQKNGTFSGVILVILIMVLLGNWKMLTGNLNGSIIAAKIPDEYWQLESYFGSNSGSAGIIALPNTSYETYTWAVNPNPSILRQDYFFKEYFFSKPIIYERASLNLRAKSTFYSNLLLNNNIDDFIVALNKTNIGYVLIQKDLISVFNGEPIDFNEFNKKIQSRSDEFEQIKDTTYFVLYKKKGISANLLSGNPLFSQKINPTHYRISLENIKTLANVNFLESFHPEWKLYLEPYSPLDCTPIATYTGTTIDSDPSKSLSKMGTGTLSTVALLQKQETEPFVLSAMKLKTLVATAFLAEIQKLFPAKTEAHTSKEPSYHTTECKPQNTFYAGGELSKLWEKPVFDDTHKVVYDYANSWTIDPEYIKANYPSSYYKQNPDGSIDIRMTLYFRPQSYFYLGLIISGTTFVLLLGYLGWSVVRRKNIAK